MCNGLEVDNDAGTGNTSDYASTLADSDTTSLLTAAREHTYENGRRFHSWRAGRYSLPNDEQEQDRMDIYHHVLSLALDGEIFKAPLGKDIHRALDLGTGTGIWAIDFADMFPSAEVIGIDLSPIQPSWVPPNVKFEVDDYEDDWTYKPEYFDYIHGRGLVGFARNWEKIISQAFTALKPGGWLEFSEAGDPFLCDDDSLPADSDHILRQWVRHWADACKKHNIPWMDLLATGKLKKMLEEAGFVDVHHMRFKVPTNPWPKEPKQKMIGAYSQMHLHDGAESITLGVFTRMLGWSAEDVHKLLAEVKPKLSDRSIHAYGDQHIVYGRKPS